MLIFAEKRDNTQANSIAEYVAFVGIEPVTRPVGLTVVIGEHFTATSPLSSANMIVGSWI